MRRPRRAARRRAGERPRTARGAPRRSSSSTAIRHRNPASVESWPPLMPSTNPFAPVVRTYVFRKSIRARTCSAGSMTGLTFSSSMILACSSRIPRRYRRACFAGETSLRMRSADSDREDRRSASITAGADGAPDPWGCEVDVSIGTLVLVPVIAVAAPLLVRFFGRVVAIPLVVFEILLGLLLGPAVLGLGRPRRLPRRSSREFGLAMLFFLAGNEIDFAAIRGRPITRAAIGWIISLVGGVRHRHHVRRPCRRGGRSSRSP